MTNQESYAAEIMMVRYAYCFSFHLDAFSSLNSLMKNIYNSFDSDQYSEEIVKNLSNALKRIEFSYTPLKKVYNVMPDLMYFLIDK